MRAKQWNCKLAKEDFRQKLVEWHLTTRESLVRTNIGETYVQRWGSFLPNQHFSVDQIPMLFCYWYEINISYLWTWSESKSRKSVDFQAWLWLQKTSVQLANMFSSWRRATIVMFQYINPLLRSYFQKEE